MMKFLAIIGLLGAMGVSALAQGSSDDIDLFHKIDLMPGGEKTSGTTAPDVKKDSTPPKEPTIITATVESSFDGKLKMATFKGDVHIKDPQFTLRSDMLTVYFKKDAESGDKAKPGASPAVKPSATPKPAASPGAAGPQGAGGAGGLERAIAEGNVIVESDRPDSNGGPPVHYVGKGAKVDYNAVNGEAIFYHWPQVQQGINTIVATEEGTVIHLFRDGRMRVEGPHRVDISDPGPGKTPEAKK
ncbi:MAG: LptA/OstA family protein [Chthoniobacteraceae bacterium]